MAIVRNESAMAVGNVVGSNIFNLLFVLGVTATIRPVPVPAGGQVDLLAMLAVAVLLFAFALRGRIGRLQAAVLLACYLGYMTWRAS